MVRHLDPYGNLDPEEGPLSLATLDDMLDVIWVYTEVNPDAALAEECREETARLYADVDTDKEYKKYLRRWHWSDTKGGVVIAERW